MSIPCYLQIYFEPVHFQNKYKIFSLKDARARAPEYHPIVGQKFSTSDQDNDSWINGNKKLFSKSFEILFISSLSFFQKETALKYTLEAGGSMIVVLVTSMVSSKMISMTSILVLHKMRKKYPFGEKRRLESPSWLFGPHSPLFQLKLITCSNYYLLLQQLLDSQFNI